jgi:hypothetical protein
MPRVHIHAAFMARRQNIRQINRLGYCITCSIVRLMFFARARHRPVPAHL